jgi:hypothetical protein
MKMTFSCEWLHKGLSRVLLALLLTPVLGASAQNNNHSDVENFVNSIAEPIYKLAWPTAAYREVSLGKIDRASGGYDVSLRLSGNSGFDGSDLWVDLVFLIRNGSLADVKVGDNNALIMPPFGTLKATVQIADAFAKEQAMEKAAASSAQASPPAQTAPSTPVDADDGLAGAACIHNSTTATIVFDYRWGVTSWQRVTLKPGESDAFWSVYSGTDRTSPPLTISYADYDDQPRTYILGRMQTRLPVICSNVENYSFQANDSVLTVYDQGQNASY